MSSKRLVMLVTLMECERCLHRETFASVKETTAWRQLVLFDGGALTVNPSIWLCPECSQDFSSFLVNSERNYRAH